MRLVADRNTWELRVFLGRDTNGHVRHRHLRFRGTKRQAERALARLAAETEAQRANLQPAALSSWGEQTTINDAIAGWKTNGWDDLSPSTTRRYHSIWSTHIRDSIGQRRIVELSPYDIERYFRALKAQGLAEASVRQARALLHRACRLAKRWSGGTLPNPIADTELPAWSWEDKSSLRAPSGAEIRQLLRAAGADDARVGSFVRLVAATGMRRGEACAVRWNDLDCERATVRLDESVVADNGGAAVKRPKTRASIRTVALDRDTLASIESLRAEQAALAASCGTVLAEDGFVFSFEPGGITPPHPDALSHGFMRVRKAAGVPGDIHLHSLRHFHSTALDAVISEAQKQARLGWASVHMARHYTDAVAEEDRRAAEHIGDLLRPDRAVAEPSPGPVHRRRLD